MNILEVKDLNMSYKTIDGNVDAVKDVSFTVKQGESFGLVGESGCGKTSVAMSLLQLQADNGKITSGEIIFDGQKPIYPKNDSLVLFSPQTQHEVPPTDGERIIMSFNIRRTQ